MQYARIEISLTLNTNTTSNPAFNLIPQPKARGTATSSANSGVYDSVVNQILTMVDGLSDRSNVLVIGDDILILILKVDSASFESQFLP